MHAGIRMYANNQICGFTTKAKLALSGFSEMGWVPALDPVMWLLSTCLHEFWLPTWNLVFETLILWSLIATWFQICILQDDTSWARLSHSFLGDLSMQALQTFTVWWLDPQEVSAAFDLAHTKKRWLWLACVCVQVPTALTLALSMQFTSLCDLLYAARLVPTYCTAVPTLLWQRMLWSLAW